MVIYSLPNTQDVSLPIAIALSAQQETNRNDQIFCSGVPLQNDLILTAAHCVKQFERHWQKDTLTIKTSRNEHESLRVSKSYIHPHYRENQPQSELDFDAAILELETSLPNNQQTRTFEIQPNQMTDTGFLWMKGFSPIRLNAATSQQALKSTETWSKLKYAEELPNEGKIKLKAERNQFAPCPGDSGAPVWQFEEKQALLKGIVVQGNCEKGEAKILNISAFQDWLQRQTQNINAKSLNRFAVWKIFRQHLFAAARMPHQGHE